MNSVAIDLASDLAKSFEGLRLEPYYDCAGFATVGYGHLLSRVRKTPLEAFQSISITEAEGLLKSDMGKALNSVIRLTKGSALNANQLAALGDFCFNLGAGNFQISTLRKLIIRNDFEGVPTELKKWNKSGGIPLRGLTRRRSTEAALFTS